MVAAISELDGARVVNERSVYNFTYKTLSEDNCIKYDQNQLEYLTSSLGDCSAPTNELLNECMLGLFGLGCEVTTRNLLAWWMHKRLTRNAVAYSPQQIKRREFFYTSGLLC